MESPLLKVGELAKRTGLTVRTLHHYDELGLLKPSHSSDSGYRLYSKDDLARLQQILSLKQLGFQLEEIRECLSRPDYDPVQTCRLHIARLSRQIEMQRRLCDRLEAFVEHFQSAGEVTNEEFLQMIEVMTMIEKYYTPEQLAQLETRAKDVGQDRMNQAPNDWGKLFADATAAMSAGVAPADPTAKELASRWLELIMQFTGGDPAIFKSLQTMYENEDNVMGRDTQAMKPVMDFIKAAAEAAGIKHPE